jgi:hypothetical protein
MLELGNCVGVVILVIGGARNQSNTSSGSGAITLDTLQRGCKLSG